MDPDDPSPAVFLQNLNIDTSAMGYSVQFQRFYVVSRDDQNLYVIDGDGNIDQVTITNSCPTLGNTSLDVSTDGYIYARDDSDDWTIVRLRLIDATTAEYVDSFSLSKDPDNDSDSSPGSDMAIHPTNGYIYMLNDTDKGIYVYDREDGSLIKKYTLDLSNVTAPSTNAEAGSQWFDGEGRLYTWLNYDFDSSDAEDYHLWRFTFDDTNDVAVAEDLGSTGSISGSGDGAACQFYTPWPDSDDDNVTNDEDLDDDNDGIPDSDEGLVCVDPGTKLSDYESVAQPDPGYNLTGQTVATKIPGLDIYHSNNLPDSTFAVYSDKQSSGIYPYHAVHKVAGSAVSPKTDVFTFKFNKPVFDLEYYLQDIDAGNSTQYERVKVDAYYQGDSVAPCEVIMGSDVYVNSNGEFESNGDGDGSPNTSVLLKYCSLVDEIRVRISSNWDTETFSHFPSGCLAQDSDGDGILDHLDLDSDNDGIPDVIEAGGTDRNGDGVIDDFLDDDGDGLSDQVDNIDSGAGDKEVTSGTPLPNPDTDGDGLKNVLDVDSDNDGMTDVNEAGGTDSDGDGRIDGFSDDDGDGLSDNVDTTEGGSALRVPDSDGDDHADYVDIDSENDGIPDNIEAQTTSDYQAPEGTDSDGDGLDDRYDPDNDAVLLVDPVDTDGDGTPDYLDLNSDNDYYTDSVEGWDTDNDGKADTLLSGVDSDGDGLDDAYDNDDTQINPTNGTVPTDYPDLDNPGGDMDWRQGLDSDNDGVADTEDLDDDNDGIPDVDECQQTSPFVWSQDTEIIDFYTANGTVNGVGFTYYSPQGWVEGASGVWHYGLLPPEYNVPNNDPTIKVSRVTTNYITFEQPVKNPTLVITSIGNAPSNPNFRPVQVEFSDPVEVLWKSTYAGLYVDSATQVTGEDGDVIVRFNGVYSTIWFKYKNFENYANVVIGQSIYTCDADNDGIPNHLDLDSDNDGIPDVIEAGGTDDDGDGIIDDFTDSDGDGLSDQVDDVDSGSGDDEVTSGTPLPNPDTDSDGLKNVLDVDSDNDGLTDVNEAGGADADGDGRIDGFRDADEDGFADSVDGTEGGSSLPTPDSDGDAHANYVDIDSDNDGIPDNIEAQSTSGYLAPVGTDSDGDGLDDRYDPDNNATLLVDPVNTDGADEPDYLDTDSDNDGDSDALEAWDTDNDGTVDVEPSGSDADNDGLDDAYDKDDTRTNPTNGTTPLDYPDLDNPGNDRDWREVKNYPPDATDNSVTVDEDTQATGNVITDDNGNGVDSDPENDPLTVTDFLVDTDGDTTKEKFNPGDTATITGVGTVTINTDGSYSFRPENNFNGHVPTIIYTITDGHGGKDSANLEITVNPVNDPPIATDNSVTIREDGKATGNVITGNDGSGVDSDPDNDDLSVIGFQVDVDGDGVAEHFGPGDSVTISGVGTITINSDGSYVFTPLSNFDGTVPPITYFITDGHGATSSAKLNISIIPMSDPPEARDDRVVTTVNTPVTINILGNDSDPDGDPISLVSVSPPSHGTLRVNPNGTITYTPESNYVGTDEFTYTIRDNEGHLDSAVVVIEINPRALSVPSLGEWGRIILSTLLFGIAILYRKRCSRKLN
ncbi:MAG: tandem-95 repeat protein [Thermodesulfobacteria bacterium]|nr:tandem-95 repeat protein [Thermodesulfobacteriota bacterium]